MAFSKVEAKVDFPAMERAILARWEKTHAFEQLRKLSAGKPKWSFLDGPITANNPMGVHHAWGRTYKDLYQRYHAALGRELRYQNGFDCQGLWVEVEVEREHGFTSKKDIEEYGIDAFVTECMARARKYAAIQTEQSKRLGYWMDWDHSYYTMSDENNYAIWAFLKKCHEKGLIYKGVDAMPWCPRCGTGISQMEMNEGYKEVGHTAVFVRFPIRERPGENLLVWTTTPWTLSANVAAAVKEDMTYVKIKQGDACFFVGKQNFESARAHPVQKPELAGKGGLMSIRAMFKSDGPCEIVEELKGEQLVGLTYDGPFDMLSGAAEAVGAHRVIAWDEVTGSEGTGIVHIAPGCGAEDYHLGKTLGLPQIAPLLEDGTFRIEFGFLGGRTVGAVTRDILADLKRRDLLFAKETYHHRYPHCWRCRDELVFRLVDEWFINMNWRERIMESAKQARWIPAWGLEREIDWLRNMGDWMISKKRYWGLALPIWECHACGHFEVMGGQEELEARAVAGWDAFAGHSPHRPWVDAVKLRCAQCGHENMSRIKEVGNPWLDASIVSLSTMGYFTDRAYWEQWFPADFVVEALPGQFRNWFYALLAVSTMMVDRPPFKVIKGHGLVLDDAGQPMHKSEGNAVWFDDAAERFGVDVMRWLYAATPPERNVLFGPQHCDDTRRAVILPLWNIYKFFADLAAVDDFKPAEHRCEAGDRSTLDRWIRSDLHRLIRTAHDSYGAFNVAGFCAEAQQFIENLSTWYVRRSRRRFYGDAWTADKRAAYATLYEVLVTLNRLLAPVIPFVTEEIYANLVRAQRADAPQSVHHVPFPECDERWIDDALSSLVAASLRLVSLARSARKDCRLKIRQPLSELIVVPGTEAEREAVDLFGDHIREELNVKAVTVGGSAEDLVSLEVEPNMRAIGPKFGKRAAAAAESIRGLDGRFVENALAGGDPVTVLVDGHAVPLEPDDVTVRRCYSEGWTGLADGDTLILLDTRVTPELRGEGIARDIIRNVQNLRKETGLDIADRILLHLASDAPELREAIQQFNPYIREETLAVEITTTPLDGPTARADMTLDGRPLAIALKAAAI